MVILFYFYVTSQPLILIKGNCLFQSEIRLKCIYGVGLCTKCMHFDRSSVAEKNTETRDKLIDIDYSCEFITLHCISKGITKQGTSR